MSLSRAVSFTDNPSLFSFCNKEMARFTTPAPYPEKRRTTSVVRLHAVNLYWWLMHNQLAQPTLPTTRLWQAFVLQGPSPYFLLLYVSPYQIMNHGILPRRICASYLLCRLSVFFSYFYFLLLQYCILRGLVLLRVCACAQSPVPRALCLDRSPSTENHGELLWDSTGAASASGPPRCRSLVGVPRQIGSMRCCLLATFAVNICYFDSTKYVQAVVLDASLGLEISVMKQLINVI